MQATLTSSYQERLGTIIADVVGPRAEAVDREAVFPAQGVAALAESGLLGLISAREVGGLGFGLWMRQANQFQKRSLASPQPRSLRSEPTLPLS